jgi:lysophospholipase L1-like esterase
MYGFAVPDWATIPTYLSRELNAGSPNCVVVSNFGVEAYVNDQELILLGEQLKAGGHPDFVVFYDGINDSSLAWTHWGPPRAHFSFATIKSRVEGSVSGRLDFLQKSYAARLAGVILAHTRSRQSFAPLISRSQPNVAQVLDNYEGNLRIARALSKAYQFKLYCFWQPILFYGHKPLVPFEQHKAEADTSGMSEESAWFLVMRSVYQEAERRAAVDSNFIFLGNLFDSTKDPIYVDEGHLGPEGNELAAKAIASYIRNDLGKR